MKLTFIGHACFRVESDTGLRILVDPYLPGAFGGKMGLKPYLEPVFGILCDDQALAVFENFKIRRIYDEKSET